MATRQCLPKARRVWERRRWPRPKEGTTATVPFSEHRRRWHTVGSSTRENTPPFSSLWAFSYRSLGLRPGKHSVWCQGVSGVVIPRFARFPLNFHRDIPSLSDARRLTNSNGKVPPGSPHFPPFQGTVPPFHEVFTLRSAPSEEGA
jgi:hypothetical protein